MKLRFPSALAFLFLFAAVGEAAAQDVDSQQASESFRQAKAAFERGDFAAAGAAFEQAAKFAPHPAPLLNAADAWERAGQIVQAAEDCDQALGMPRLEPAHREEAETCLRKLSPRLSTLNLRGAITDAVRIDGGPPLGMPTRKRLVPGSHVLTVIDLASSRTRTIGLSLGPGEEQTLEVGGASSPTEQGARRVPVAAWIAFGTVVASAAVATVFGISTLETKSDFDSGDHSQATADAFFRNRAITNVALGISAVAAITGVVLWATAPRVGMAASIRFAPSATAARVAAELHF